MSKHTPGPWSAGSPPNGARGYIYCDDATGSAVAQTQLAYVTRPEEENDANAKLIAAAPEMLTALRRSLNWLSSYPGGGAMNCYDDVRAAIAKALGE